MIYAVKDTLTSPIINNYQIFVNEKGIENIKNIILQKIYVKKLKIFIAVYAIPAPIKGPTATPLKIETDKIVPNTSAVVICGSFANNVTPPFASNATNIPEISAIQAMGDLKAPVKSLKPICPLAIGANTAMVIIVTPQFIPLVCKNEKDFASKPLIFNKISTAIEIIKELFFAINPITNKRNKNKNDSLNIFHTIPRLKLSYHNFSSMYKN